MAQDEKTDSGRSPGKDLISKIAKAYRNMPREPQAKPKPDQHDIQNPELDQAFDRMVRMYKGETPQREESVVPLPIPLPIGVPKLGAEQAEEYECQQCGRKNPVENRFCGTCGTARRGAAPAARPEIEPPQPRPPLPRPVKVKQVQSPQPKQRYRTNPYLLLVLVLLLGVIAWQQWGVHQPSANRPPSAPALQAPTQLQVPARSLPSPGKVPVSPAAVPTQESSTKTAKKAAVRAATARPGATIPQAGPAQAQFVTSPEPSGPPIAPYQSLTDRPIPVLPSFASPPPKPESVK